MRLDDRGNARRRGIRIVWLASMLLATAAAHAQAPSLEVHGKLPTFQSVALSPTGGRIALVAWLNENRTVLILGSDNKLQRTFTIADMKVVSLQWAGVGMPH